MYSPSLHRAISSGRLHQTRLLLEIGSKPSLADNQGRTPLILAACLKEPTIALRITRLLLSHGARADCKDLLGRTALSYACENGHCKLVKLLLDDDDFDVNMADIEGNTPLMYAAMYGNVQTLREILHVIVNYGLSVDLRNNKGFSAYLLASKMSRTECARILKAEAGASVGVRDSEFFLNDEEWAKKVNKNFKKEKVKLTVRNTRLKTSPGVSQISVNNPRVLSRLTNRSELEVTSQEMKTEDTWCLRSERETNTEYASTLSESCSSYLSDNHQISVPTIARAQSHDLHAIFSHYTTINSRPVVTIADHRFLDPASLKHVDLKPHLKAALQNSHSKQLGRKKFPIPIKQN
ncbi:uncharacterized protein [Montipora foliosa]|uniref:uncharacterized protein n=1 Tax=Montipora foliosa TaxID=591990 RepID=UPI0035F12994